MARLGRTWVAVLALTACDLPSADERKAEIDSAIEAEVKPLAEKNKEQGEALTKLTDKLDAQQEKLTDLSAQVVGLEAQLAIAQSRLDGLEKAKEDAEPKPTVRPGRPDPAAYYKVEVGDSATLGPDTALVTIVTWSDFQCPYCKRVTPTIDTLRADYGADIRYVFKHQPLPFHKEAEGAAHAAEAAGKQGKFWEMHDRLFENGKSLGDSNYKKWARELGLDVTRFERDRKSAAIAAAVQADSEAGMKLGARGTPSFFINGRFLSGAQPVPMFKKLIDEEMEKAKAKVAAGTARADVYAATIAAGKTEP